MSAKRLKYEVRYGKDCVRLEFYEIDENDRETSERPAVGIDFRAQESLLLAAALLEGGIGAGLPNAPEIPPSRQKAG